MGHLQLHADAGGNDCGLHDVSFPFFLGPQPQPMLYLTADPGSDLGDGLGQPSCWTCLHDEYRLACSKTGRDV